MCETLLLYAHVKGFAILKVKIVSKIVKLFIKTPKYFDIIAQIYGVSVDTLEKIINILENENIFLTGGGGVGKSYLCNQIIQRYKSQNRQVVVLGSTGISAVHVGGQTVHSFFGFGITNSTEELKRHDKKQSRKLKQLYTILSKCELLIIDEISMISAWLLDMIRFRLVSSNFRGRVLFVGDFFQLPPVNKSQKDGFLQESIYAFSSSSWEYYEPKIIMLTKPKRTQDMEFFKVLERVRMGELDDDTILYLENLTKQDDILIDNPTVLFGRNKEANSMNKKRLYELENELFMLPAIEEIIDEKIHFKKLQTWKNALNVDEFLELKVGASVLFCTNKIGNYYNGQRGQVIGIDEDSIDVQKDDFSIVSVQRHEYNLTDIVAIDGEAKEITLASMKQFPLKLAYAITIHKSQGMSIEKLACNIDNIFEKSQFYVALSRAINPEKLYLFYSGYDFKSHIKRSVQVDSEVVKFYENCDTIQIEEER